LKEKKMKEKLKRLLQAAPNSEAGFTLTEMLIVVAIIAMIGTFAVGKIQGAYNKAKVDSTKIQIRNLSTLLDNYRLDCNFYPTTDQGLDALVQKPTAGRECKNYNPEGYAKKIPKDGWGNDFIFESDGNKFTIKSLGQDGQEGGEGNAADITSDNI
jgi:general secretion pathway protein G